MKIHVICRTCDTPFMPTKIYSLKIVDDLICGVSLCPHCELSRPVTIVWLELGGDKS